MQIRATKSWHLTPVRLRMKDSTRRQGRSKRGTLSTLVMLQMSMGILENTAKLSQMLKLEQPHRPAIPPSTGRILRGGPEISVLKMAVLPFGIFVHSSPDTQKELARFWLWCAYTMEYYSAVKNKQEIALFGTAWVNLEGIMSSEINQAERGGFSMISLQIWSLKKLNPLE